MSVSRTEFEEVKGLLDKTVREKQALEKRVFQLQAQQTDIQRALEFKTPQEQENQEGKDSPDSKDSPDFEGFQRLLFSEMKRDQEQTLREFKKTLLEDIAKQAQQKKNQEAQQEEEKQKEAQQKEKIVQVNKPYDTKQQRDMTASFQRMTEQFKLLDQRVSDIDHAVIEFKSEQIPSSFQKQLVSLKGAIDGEYAPYFQSFVSVKEYQKSRDLLDSLETQVRQMKSALFQQTARVQEYEESLESRFSEERWKSLERSLIDILKKDQEQLKKDVKAAHMMERVKLFADIERQRQKNSEIETELRKELSRNIFLEEIQLLNEKISLEFDKVEKTTLQILQKQMETGLEQRCEPLHVRLETLETKEPAGNPKELEALQTYVKQMERALLEEIQKVAKKETTRTNQDLAEPFAKLQGEFSSIRAQWTTIRSANIEERYKKEMTLFQEECVKQLETLRTNITDTEDFHKIKERTERTEQMAKAAHADVFKYKVYFEAFEKKYNELYFKTWEDTMERKQRLFESYLESHSAQRIDATKESIRHEILSVQDSSNKENIERITSTLDQFEKKNELGLELFRKSLEEYTIRADTIYEGTKGVQNQCKELDSQIQKRMWEFSTMSENSLEEYTHILEDIQKQKLELTIQLEGIAKEFQEKKQENLDISRKLLEAYNQHIRDAEKRRLELEIQTKIHEEQLNGMDQQYRQMETYFKKLHSESHKKHQEIMNTSDVFLEKYNRYLIDIHEKQQEFELQYKTLEVKIDTKKSDFISISVKSMDEYREYRKYIHEKTKEFREHIQMLNGTIEEKNKDIHEISTGIDERFELIKQELSDVSTQLVGIYKTCLEKIQERAKQVDTHFRVLLIQHQEKIKNPIPINMPLTLTTKKCFVSACIGNRGQSVDKIIPFQKVVGWDMILFSNKILSKQLAWDVRPIVPTYDDPALEAKMYKWLTHKFLPEYDIVVWIDCYLSPNPHTIHNFDALLQKAFFIENKAIVHRRNPERNCVWEECEKVVESKRATEEDMKKHLRVLQDVNMPEHGGLFDTNIVCKLNKDPEVMRMGEAIFETMVNTSSRDELVVTPIYHKNTFQNYYVHDSQSMFLKTGTHVRVPVI